MKIRLIFFLLILTSTSHIYAQTNRGTLSGKIFDGESKEIIPAATVRVLSINDSTLVTGTSSNKEGAFSIPLTYGKYIAQFSFVGYNDTYYNIELSSSNPSHRTDSVFLNENSILLDEAVITAQSLEIVVRGDTLEYNAAAYNVAEMAVVEDLLKQMPGVEIDAEGVIKVQGKEIRKIFVDGKEFFSDDPKVASKNLPARMIDKLQVLDNKSEMEKMTGFDDGNEEMIINLTVKPDMKRGAFGNAFVGYGNKDRYEANAMVNYMRNSDQVTLIGSSNNTNNAGFSDLGGSMGGGGRGMRRGGGGSGINTSSNGGINFSKNFTDKLELGGSSHYGRSNNQVSSKTFTQNYLTSGDTFEDEENNSNNISENAGFDMRLQWKPDSLTSIVFRPNFSVNRNESAQNGEFITTRENGDTINHGNSNYTSSGSGRNLGGSLDFNRRLGKIGRTLSIRLSANSNDSKSNAVNLSDTYYSGNRPDDLLDQRITNTNKSSSWNGYISYIEPIGEKYYLQFSYNYRQNKSDTDRDTRITDDEGNYTILDEQYSRLNLNNSTNQDLGVNFRSRTEKYNYSIGFSAYPSSSERKTYIGDSLIVGSDITQKVTNYSPNAQFNYLWTRQKNIRINYNGRTSQPSVNQISPVIDVTNPLNITYGNPDLKPSFSHNVDVRYQHSIPESNRFYMLNTGFNYVSNAIVSSRFTDSETGRRENTYMNVDGNWNGNIRFTTTQPLKNKKFSISTTSYAGYSLNNGYSNFEENVSKQLNLSENVTFNFNSEKAQFSIRGNFSYNKVENSLEGQNDREFMNYGGSANTTLHLPYDFTIQSDIRYSTNSGYADGFQQNETLWNASIEKQVLKQKNGIIRLKIYDILQQRSNINRSVTSNYIRDTTTNTLTSYFIVNFVYRFNVFSGGASRDDMRRGRGPGGSGRGTR